MECTMYLYYTYLLYKMEVNMVKPWFRAQDSGLENAQNRQNIWKQSAEALGSMYSASRHQGQIQIQTVHSRAKYDSWRGFCPEALLAGWSWLALSIGRRKEDRRKEDRRAVWALQIFCAVNSYLADFVWNGPGCIYTVFSTRIEAH